MQHSTQRWTLLGKVRVGGQAGTWKSESCSSLTAGQHLVTERCPPSLRLLIWEVVPTHVGLQQKAPRTMRQKLQFCAVHGAIQGLHTALYRHRACRGKASTSPSSSFTNPGLPGTISTCIVRAR